MAVGGVVVDIEQVTMVVECYKQGENTLQWDSMRVRSPGGWAYILSTDVNIASIVSRKIKLADILVLFQS